MGMDAYLGIELSFGTEYTMNDEGWNIAPYVSDDTVAVRRLAERFIGNANLTESGRITIDIPISYLRKNYALHDRIRALYPEYLDDCYGSAYVKREELTKILEDFSDECKEMRLTSPSLYSTIESASYQKLIAATVAITNALKCDKEVFKYTAC